MSFCIRDGGSVELQYGSTETEAVRIAVSSLERDLKKVLPGTEVCRNGNICQKEHVRQEKPVIVIRTLSGEETAIPGVDRKQMTGGDGKLFKEAYQLKVQDGKLYITGTDRRGTIYGIYTFCEWMGVSPWYFWADVPVRKKEELVLEEGYCQTDWPSVEYRGIFINDEEELDVWVRNYIGEPTIGIKSYEKIFELLLRLRANYIWPAMHVNSFNLKPENGALAERMGIVAGTSHCDMLMRSNNREWIPWIQKKGYTDAVYDYSVEGRNRDILKEYWKESVEQNCGYEVCYTLGMRGIHDSGFETKNLEGKTPGEIRSAKVTLLEKIISDQREILQDVLGHETMMTFIPYKEVLELYDHGLKIPEDMTLVWANDNYGHIRRYPSETEKRRKGGNGIYYHNSYWAGPGMSYVFLCSIPLAHTGNELKKAWNEGIRRLWVLNSGAMKPLEQEITFFLRLAWEIGKPGALTEDVEAFTEDWVNRTFSGNIGKQVSVLLNDFSQLTNVRKLENMEHDVFSQTAYGDEAAMRIHQYEEMFRRGNALYEKLPGEEKDSFFQLVLMRIHAAYFTNLSYYYGDRSTLMYDRGNMQAAAFYTDKSREAEDARRRLLYYYNHVMCGGKWNGILDPEGFPPPRAAMMPLCTPPLVIEGAPAMRVDIWNDEEELCFASDGEKWIEIGNTGAGEFEVRLQAPQWAKLSEESAVVRRERRILVRVSNVSENRQGTILIENSSDGSVWSVPVRTVKPVSGDVDCVQEEDGLVALEARLAKSGDFRRIRRLGRMQGDLLEACAQREPEGAAVCGNGPEEERRIWKGEPLRYRFAVCSGGEFLLEIHRFPSLNSVGRIRIGVSVDDGPVQVVESFSNDEWRGNWKENVLNNVERLYWKLPMLRAGAHCLCIWSVDKYFAFSRLVIYTKPRKENNLAGIKGRQPLPAEWEMRQWCDSFYGKYILPPRPVFFAAFESGGENLAATCRVAEAGHYGRTVRPDRYLEWGKHIFGETDGAIRIDAAAALAQSGCAWTQDPAGTMPEKEHYEIRTGGLWRHCASESFGRSGLALYIRTPGLRWKVQNAPGLHYRIKCEGGAYTIWMLSKFARQEEGCFSIGIDGEVIPQERLYRNGCLWRYEAEQIYRWTPAAYVNLEQGEHVLHVYALASGMRYDRFYMTRGNEEPPMDADWKK